MLAIALFIALLIVTFPNDQKIIVMIGQLRKEPVDMIMLWITNRGLIAGMGVLGTYLLLKKKYTEFFLITLSITFGMEVTYLLKKVFQAPRPNELNVNTYIPLAVVSGYAFPSLHATFCFATIPYLSRIFHKKWLIFLISILLVTIVFSRIYLGVHFLSDLIGGGVIGYLSAKTFIYLQEKYGFLPWMVKHLRTQLELRRKLAHALTGAVILILLRFNIINALILSIILVMGGVLSLIIRKYPLPIIYQLLCFFERPKDIKTFPGRGSFFLVLGSFLAVILYAKNVALAAIAIMTVGDALTTIIGMYFGKTKNPLNHNKHFEGTVVAIIFSTLAAMFFVDFSHAFIGATIGMLVEFFMLRYFSRYLDDNLLIPLVAGFAMMLL